MGLIDFQQKGILKRGGHNKFKKQGKLETSSGCFGLLLNNPIRGEKEGSMGQVLLEYFEKINSNRAYLELFFFVLFCFSNIDLNKANSEPFQFFSSKY